MSDNIIFLWAIVAVALFVAVLYLLGKSGPGCSGDCNQGRKPCNCRDETNQVK